MRTRGAFPVLTVQPPWSWAALYAGMSPQNQARGTRYRGPAWLYAGRIWDVDGEWSALLREAWAGTAAQSSLGESKSLGMLRPGTPWVTTGAVTALIQVTGCHHADQCGRRDGTLCSPWAFAGQYHVLTGEPHLLARPVPARGPHGWWELPPEAEETAREQLGAPYA